MGFNCPSLGKASRRYRGSYRYTAHSQMSPRNTTLFCNPARCFRMRYTPPCHFLVPCCDSGGRFGTRESVPFTERPYSHRHKQASAVGSASLGEGAHDFVESVNHDTCGITGSGVLVRHLNEDVAIASWLGLEPIKADLAVPFLFSTRPGLAVASVSDGYYAKGSRAGTRSKGGTDSAVSDISLGVSANYFAKRCTL